MKLSNHQTKLIALLIAAILLILLLMGLFAKKSNKSEVIEPLQGDFASQVQTTENRDSIGMLLPDFTQLVAREGGAVVNIQAMSDNENKEDQAFINDPLYELFKRMLPNQPQWEQEGNEANFGDRKSVV